LQQQLKEMMQQFHSTQREIQQTLSTIEEVQRKRDEELSSTISLLKKYTSIFRIQTQFL
jgi:hypothetical protein